MITKNTTEATTKASYLLNAENGQMKVLVAKKSEEKKSGKAVAAFAKNTRYSIYNNGGGYTGL